MAGSAKQRGYGMDDGTTGPARPSDCADELAGGAEDRAELRAQLSEVRQSLGKLGRTAARRGSARSKAVVDASRQKVDDSYRTVTLKEYRDEVDRALADITQVLVVLEARVSALESAATVDG
jgi:hypothetical protein